MGTLARNGLSVFVVLASVTSLRDLPLDSFHYWVYFRHLFESCKQSCFSRQCFINFFENNFSK